MHKKKLKMPKGKRTAQNALHSGEFLGAMLSGIAPRSTNAAKIHRLYRDGHATEDEFKDAISKDALRLVDAQRHFAFESAGQLDWPDVMRPLTRCFEGFTRRASSGEDAAGPITRWFRTDTFYRKPLVSGRIDCAGGELAGFLPDAGRNAVVFLPSPYSLARMVENTFYQDDCALAIDYARAVSKSARALHAKGYRCILLVEPFVGYEQSRGIYHIPDWFPKPISDVRCPGMTVGINFPAAEIREVLPFLDGAGVDFVGVDTIFATDFKVEIDKDVLLGVVDASRPTVESHAEIASRVKDFLSKASFSGRYYVGPNDRLYDVPFEIALSKVSALAQFRGV